MREILLYVLAVLAVYRVARIIAMEEGPGGVFQRIRDRIDPEQATSLGRGLNCPLCTGAWLSLFVALMLPFVTWEQTILSWFGIAGAQTLLHLWIEK